MKNIWLILGGLSILSLGSCTWNEKKQLEKEDTTGTPIEEISKEEISAHTSENSLDWNGEYVGLIPCADCPGIQTTVVLNTDGTFSYTGVYLERDTKIEDTGKFMWHNNGSVVHLAGKDVNMKFQVGENQLISLDIDGNPIEGPLKDNFILKKKN